MCGPRRRSCARLGCAGEGRTKWRLCREGVEREIDVSCKRLICAKHVTVGKTPDADKETWEMLEEAKDPAWPDTWTV